MIILQRNPVVLCILDGWGLAPPGEGNAITLANTPVYDHLHVSCPHAELITHGEAVGLPEGSIGNSEVGHLHIGAGRVVPMDRLRIDGEIDSGEFMNLPELIELRRYAREFGRAIHVVGIISDSGVHGLIRHVITTCDVLQSVGTKIFVHVITDGRDSPPGLAHQQVCQLESRLPAGAKIATVSGRYYAMDRDQRWPRVELAWNALINAIGRQAGDAGEAVALAQKHGESDEFIKPTIIGRYPGFESGDCLAFTNFRSDRMRQLVSSLLEPGFAGFKISEQPAVGRAISMVDYFNPPRPWLMGMFRRPAIKNDLGSWLAKKGVSQFRLAETEKYPHVTYFFNGGNEAIYSLEDRMKVQSPNVATYDLAPEMSAREVADQFCKAMVRGYDFILVNIANPDMVGHTGNLEAAVFACEATDEALGSVCNAVTVRGATMLVTADHGNCEVMIDPISRQPHTAHTTNKVPAILFGSHRGVHLRSGSLADLAPTILDLIGLDKPPEMTGNTLLY